MLLYNVTYHYTREGKCAPRDGSGTLPWRSASKPDNRRWKRLESVDSGEVTWIPPQKEVAQS